MNKFLKIIFVLLCSLLMIVACTELDDDTDIVDDDTNGAIGVDEDRDVDDEDVTDKDVTEAGDLGTRDKPYPLGEKVLVEYDDFVYGNVQAEVTVNSMIRGEEAEQIVMNENEFSEPSGEGKEYVIANITVKLIDIEESEHYSEFGYDIPFFEWVSITGRTYDEFTFAVVPDELMGTLYEGGEKTGNIIGLVEEGDDILIKLGSRWFSLK